MKQVFIDIDSKNYYQKEYSQWLHRKNVKEKSPWKPCEYFNQLNMALTSSHSIFNYSMFLALLPNKKNLPERELLVLDEGHLIETEIVKFRGLTISKKRWKRYTHDFEIIDYGYDDVENWIDFLIELETKILTLIGNSNFAESLATERKVKYNYWKGKFLSVKNNTSNKSKIVHAVNYSIVTKKLRKNMLMKVIDKSATTLGDEFAIDAIRDIERLTITINSILSNTKNWIVSDIKKENYEVVKVELKPLDTSNTVGPYLKNAQKH